MNNQPEAQQELKGGEPSSFRGAAPWVLALVFAGIAPNLLVLDLLLGVPMSLTAPLLLPVAVLGVVGLYVFCRRRGLKSLATAILVGVLLGAASTAAYDVFRLGGKAAGYIESDEAADFGVMILGSAHGNETMPSDPHDGGDPHASEPHGAVALLSADAHGGHGEAATATERAVGYAYHYWNGAMFGMAFLVLFGRTKWWGPVLWMVLFVYPLMVLSMGVHSVAGVWIEAVGHAAYGAVFGIFAPRWVAGHGLAAIVPSTWRSGAQ